MKDRKEKYGEFHVVHSDYAMSHLWTLDLPAEESEALPEPKRLTQGDSFTVGEFES